MPANQNSSGKQGVDNSQSQAERVADAGDAGSGTPSPYADDGDREDLPQPAPRDYSGTRTGKAEDIGSEASSVRDYEILEDSNDDTGGKIWNRTLGDNTAVGMIRFLGGVGLFILVVGSLFWLIA